VSDKRPWFYEGNNDENQYTANCCLLKLESKAPEFAELAIRLLNVFSPYNLFGTESLPLVVNDAAKLLKEVGYEAE
jgi:hypothetical protein